MNNPMWTLQEARILCEQVENELAPMGAHVALGGSCLYRGSSEKDVDLFIYPHKTTKTPKEAHVISALSSVGMVFKCDRPHEQYGDDKRVLQFEYQEKRVDVFMMFPVAYTQMSGREWTFEGTTVAGVLRYENAPQGWINQQVQYAPPPYTPTPPTPSEIEFEQAMLDAAERAIPPFRQ